MQHSVFVVSAYILSSGHLPSVCLHCGRLRLPFESNIAHTLNR